MKNIIKFTIFILILTATQIVYGQKNKNNTSTVILSTHMHCGSCEQKVEQALIYSKGVKRVNADHTKSIVEVKFNNKKTNIDNIIAELEKINYKAKVIKEE